MSGDARRGANGGRGALGVLAAMVILLCAAAAAQESPHPEGVPTFTLREENIKVLRQAVAMWAPIESGVPGVMISTALIDEKKDLLQDLAARAGLAWSNPPTAAQREAAKRLFEEMPQAFAQLLERGVLAPGAYSYPNPLPRVPHAENMLPTELAALAKDPTGRITITKEHLTLLRAGRWQALFMNPKRPYGDMTYFELDMAGILGERVERRPDGKLPEVEEKRLFQLHVELLPTLQVYLQKATLAPGAYPQLAVEPMRFGSHVAP